jgi:hypothetical protein
MYVGTEQGVSIIDIKTNKVVSPQVPTQKRFYMYIVFWVWRRSIFLPSLMVYIKLMKQVELPRLSLLCCIKNMYSLGLLGTLYNANNGFINKFDIMIHKRNFSSSQLSL